MKVVVDWELVLQYLLKYVTKPEKHSNYLEELNKIRNAKPDMSVNSFFMRLVSKQLSRRDVS